VVNSAGNVADPRTGLPWQADMCAEFGLVPPPAGQIASFAQRADELSPFNTTIAVVATDAALSKAACKRVAVAAQDAFARTMRPAHTALDGDSVFVLSTGAVEVAPASDTPAAMSPETKLMTMIGAAAADCLASAVMVGVLAAESVAGIPTYRDVLPGSFP
jgi:L-aminopeptidase/D-esterase-like protein